MTDTATLERARTAMQEHAWADAFERLSSLDADRALAARDLEHRRAHGFAPQIRIGLHSAEATTAVGDYVGLGVHETVRVGALAGRGRSSPRFRHCRPRGRRSR